MTKKKIVMVPRRVHIVATKTTAAATTTMGAQSGVATPTCHTSSATQMADGGGVELLKTFYSLLGVSLSVTASVARLHYTIAITTIPYNTLSHAKMDNLETGIIVVLFLA